MGENPNGICFDRDTLAGKTANKQEFLRVAVFARAMFVLSSTAESKEPVRACVFRVADHTGKKELAKRTFRNMRRKYSEGSLDGSPCIPLHFLSPVTVPKFDQTSSILQPKSIFSSFRQLCRFTFVNLKY